MTSTTGTMEERKPYRMTIGLNVLNHLGINLYSSIPAVLGEVVANSWDADATDVRIQLDPENGLISITDDGSGMSEDDINGKYLFVGYERRKNPVGAATESGRQVMGRKGIGKLSLFSIANTVIVETAKDGHKSGFAMSAEAIRNAITGNAGEIGYYPEPLPEHDIAIDNGTRISLRDLKVGTMREGPLRKRLARRFSVIGTDSNFHVYINDKEITIEDRDYFSKLDYLWHYPEDGTDYKDVCGPYLRQSFGRSGRIRDEQTGEDYNIKGWIGTVKSSGMLKDENNDNLNKLAIMIRGKVAHENMLDEFAEGGIYNSYVVGEINADFLDADEKADITTTSRQRLREDDNRFKALRKWLYGELKEIQGKWSHLRDVEGEERALEIPEIKRWYDSKPRDVKEYAKKLFGKVYASELRSDDTKREFFRYAAIAVEGLEYSKSLKDLEGMDATSLEALSNIFSRLDNIEAALYYQVAKARIDIISKLRQAVDENRRERVLQEFLFDHLWLLDPSWERATECNPLMEKRLMKAFGVDEGVLTPEESLYRIDIGFRLWSGKYIIVELKKSDRVLGEAELIEQVIRYRDAAEKAIRLANDQPYPPYEIICIIGKPLREWVGGGERMELTQRTLANYNARVVTYDRLINGAYRAYSQYLDKNVEAERIFGIINRLSSDGDLESRMSAAERR